MRTTTSPTNVAERTLPASSASSASFISFTSYTSYTSYTSFASRPASQAQKHAPVSPLPATLTHSLSRNPFVCRSYANTRDGVAVSRQKNPNEKEVPWNHKSLTPIPSLIYLAVSTVFRRAAAAAFQFPILAPAFAPTMPGSSNNANSPTSAPLSSAK